MEWAGAWQIGNVTATFLSAPLDPFVHVWIHIHIHVYTHALQTYIVIPSVH